MCPEFVVAVVKCAATRGDSKNGIGSHIIEADVKSIGKRIDLVKEANEKMVNAKTILANNSFGEQKYYGVLARGNMECDMVDYVFEKMSKADLNDTSIDEIAENFLKEVCGVEKPISATGEEPEANNNDEDVFNPSENIVEQTMLNHGFRLGLILRKS